MVDYLPLPIPGWILLGIGILIVSLYDLRLRRVPNWLNASVCGSGLTVQLLAGGLPAAAWGLGGSLAGVLLLLLPFAKRWIGAGDVKFLGALGAWLGPRLTAEALLAGAIVGGLLSLYYLVKAPAGQRRSIFTNLRLSAYTRSVPEVEDRLLTESPPYAVALGAGVLVVLALHRRNLVWL